MGGFTCIGSLSSNYDGKGRTYAVPSSHASLIAIGDVVTETGTADANGDAQVDVATASTIVKSAVWYGRRSSFSMIANATSSQTASGYSAAKS